MKSLFSLFLLIVLISSQSCSKTANCTEVEYNTAFTIMADQTYCLPGGAEITIHSINNDFCPCFVLCDWEGLMTLDLTWTDEFGIIREGNKGTHRTVDIGSEELENLSLVVADLEDSITFVEACSDENPSPKISAAMIIVSE